MNKKSLLEREITKTFILGLNPEMKEFEDSRKCFSCGCYDCECINNEQENQHSQEKEYGQSEFELNFDKNGIINPDDLYNHFDLNHDGKVSKEEYTDHIDYHCENPETLDHYKEEVPVEVPCNDSYQRTKEYFSKNENELLSVLDNICLYEDACEISCCQAILDLIKKRKQNR